MNGESDNMALRRSDIEMSTSARHGASVKLISVLGGASRLRSPFKKCAVCLMLSVTSGLASKPPRA